jgi:hypothetical protein
MFGPSASRKPRQSPEQARAGFGNDAKSDG